LIGEHIFALLTAFFTWANRPQKTCSRCYHVDMPIVQSPLVGGAEIVRAYEPVVRGTMRGRLSYLRQRRAISGGVRRVVRGPEGRIEGSLHFYSQLNREAARLFRRGDVEGSQRLALDAAQLEATEAFQSLVDALAQSAQAHSDLAAVAARPWVELQALASMSQAIRASLELTVEGMDAVGSASETWMSAWAGIVESMEPTFAAIRTMEGTIAYPLIQLRNLGLDHVGAAVAVEWETLDSGSQVVSAIGALAMPSEKHGYSVFDYRPRMRLDERRWARLTGPRPMMPQMVPLPIPLPPAVP
jgi:hypothetical protein